MEASRELAARRSPARTVSGVSGGDHQRSPSDGVQLAAEINWDFSAKRFSSVCHVGPGQLPLRPEVFIPKHMHNLSDEAVCDRR